MARNSYDLKFIHLDYDFFDKEKTFLIEEKYGYEGCYIAVRLLLWIAAKGGFGTEWDEETSPRYFAAKGLGDKNKGELVANVVTDLFEVGFFDRAALAESGLLTSPEIVRDWLKAYKQYSKTGTPTDGLPSYVTRIITKQEPSETSPENPKKTPKLPENSPNLRGTSPENPEKTPLEKNRIEKNIYIPPKARARTREETAQNAQDGESAQNGEELRPYTEEERSAALGKIELWNQVTEGTGAEYLELYPQEILISRIIDRIRSGTKEEDWRRAFTAARRETEAGEMPWTLPAVFNKPGNFDQLKISKPKTAAKPGGGGRFGMDRPGFGEEGFYK